MNNKINIKELINLSGEKLTYKEFKEYIKDYTLNYKEYGIKKSTSYYKAIKWALTAPNAYTKYEELF